MPDTLNPNISVLVKLGSLAVHVEEMLSPFGHEFDKTAIEALLSDPELKEWIEGMTVLGFMPVERVDDKKPLKNNKRCPKCGGLNSHKVNCEDEISFA